MGARDGLPVLRGVGCGTPRYREVERGVAMRYAEHDGGWEAEMVVAVAKGNCAGTDAMAEDG